MFHFALYVTGFGPVLYRNMLAAADINKRIHSLMLPFTEEMQVLSATLLQKTKAAQEIAAVGERILSASARAMRCDDRNSRTEFVDIVCEAIELLRASGTPVSRPREYFALAERLETTRAGSDPVPLMATAAAVRASCADACMLRLPDEMRGLRTAKDIIALRLSADAVEQTTGGVGIRVLGIEMTKNTIHSLLGVLGIVFVTVYLRALRQTPTLNFDVSIPVVGNTPVS
eukprot:c7234_g1_i1.p1 GENE.c7234_g1_i1~~c7234_g1_i1.p1  ORF type:complete len:242 (+),score=40.16 c7234_g1_i1:37-726(+)